MNLKKYRVCLALFIVVMIAAGIIYYVSSTKKMEIPTDGMLVKNMEYCQDGEKV